MIKPKHLGQVQYEAKILRPKYEAKILRPKYLGQSQRSISNMKPKY